VMSSFLPVRKPVLVFIVSPNEWIVNGSCREGFEACVGF
jgi:hypothetical protein